MGVASPISQGHDKIQRWQYGGSVRGPGLSLHRLSAPHGRERPWYLRLQNPHTAAHSVTVSLAAPAMLGHQPPGQAGGGCVHLLVSVRGYKDNRKANLAHVYSKEHVNGEQPRNKDEFLQMENSSIITPVKTCTGEQNTIKSSHRNFMISPIFPNSLCL